MKKRAWLNPIKVELILIDGKLNMLTHNKAGQVSEKERLRESGWN